MHCSMQPKKFQKRAFISEKPWVNYWYRHPRGGLCYSLSSFFPNFQEEYKFMKFSTFKEKAILQEMFESLAEVDPSVRKYHTVCW